MSVARGRGGRPRCCIGRAKRAAAAVAVALIVPAAAGASARRAPSIALVTRGGDVWAWSVRVVGRSTCARGAKITVRGGRIAVAATRRGDGFSATVVLHEGRNRVTALCRAATSAAVTYRVRLRERPTALVRVSVHGSRVVLDGGDSVGGGPSRARLVRFSWSERKRNPAALHLRRVGRRVALAAPRRDGEYYVTLRVSDARGRSDESTVYFVVRNGRARRVDLATGNPAWVEGAIVYGVIPDRFGRHGFRAVTAKLDYLRRLGVDAIWLSPINSTLPGDFGYAVTDYFGLRPDYGTKGDFARLVNAAHRRGIRVLMDFVPNHTSKEHPYFRDTEAYGRSSRYWNFYDRNRRGNYTYYFDWRHLPNLNYGNPEVRRMVVEAFSYWVREFDVDGFRVDAAWGVAARRPQFWPQWRRELKRIKPDLLLLAEASARNSYYFRDGFDAAYDWTNHVGRWAWQSVFDNGTAIAPALDRALRNPPRGYGPDALVFRFLNNNDTGRRFIAAHGVRLTRVAAAALLTLPGLPCVYTGDEVGARYLPYALPRPIPWKDRLGLRPYYTRLIALRHRFPSIRSRRLFVDRVDMRYRIYDYFRFGRPSERPVLVVLSFARRRVDVQIRLPARFRSFGRRGMLDDALAHTTLTVGRGRTLRIPMEPMSARVLLAPE